VELQVFLHFVVHCFVLYDCIVPHSQPSSNQLQQSVEFNTKQNYQSLIGIVQKLNQAKDMWNAKQRLMTKMWEDGVLDDGVISRWKSSMDEYENRIAAMDAKVSFFQG
jgi:hypothetical protein